MKYKVELISPDNSPQFWVVRGLAPIDPPNDPELEKVLGVDPEKDTILYAFEPKFSEKEGLPWDQRYEDAAVVLEGEIGGLHSILYDERQMNDQLKDGDIFEVEPAQVRQWHSWEKNLPVFDLPRQRFVVYDTHVVHATLCREHDVVKLRQADEEGDRIIPKGTEGVVVHIHGDCSAYEVEFPAAPVFGVRTLRPWQLDLVEKKV